MTLHPRLLAPCFGAIIVLSACSGGSGTNAGVDVATTTRPAASATSSTTVSKPAATTKATKPATPPTTIGDAELDAVATDLAALEQEANALDQAANATQENS